jgi:hypothetical protein
MQSPFRGSDQREKSPHANKGRLQKKEREPEKEALALWLLHRIGVEKQPLLSQRGKLVPCFFAAMIVFDYDTAIL